MRYVTRLPFEVRELLRESDPDVRSIERLPGFVDIGLLDRSCNRYELTIEVEAGSLRDALDAAEELLVDYQDALASYHPRPLATIAPEPR